MARINRNLALQKQTDIARWSDSESLEMAWDARAEFAAQFIPAGARVLDLSCGRMSVQRFLPNGCSYQGCDIVARDKSTVVCDFNAGEFPTQAAAEADIIVMLGVLEYVVDVESFFTHLRFCKHDVVMSYCATDLSRRSRPRGARLGQSSQLLRSGAAVRPLRLPHRMHRADRRHAGADAADADRTAGAGRALQRRGGVVQR